MKIDRPIRARILGYHLTQADPGADLMAVEIISDVRDPARPDQNLKGQIVMAGHGDDYADHNRAIKDLFRGSLQWMVPQCLVGSELSLAGCEFVSMDEVRFTSYHNVEPYFVAPGKLPDPSDYFEGEWVAPARAATDEEMAETDRRVAEELALQGHHGAASNPW